jgi:predicted GIY-YIG superfamily endonuclease
MNWYCYILRCVNENHKNLTYNGYTTNLERRLKQHNGLISGGAKATRGKKWEYYAIITGFKSSSNALSCEWRIKKPTGQKKRPPIYCGVNGRIKGLSKVLQLDMWTSKCIILNNECEYTLYITNDVYEYLEIENIPKNIKIITIDKISDIEFSLF